jgi:CheY-like chemotaxis protein
LAKHRRQTAGAETEAGLILVVEDIAAARELTCHTLRAEKWEVMEACDGLEALAAVARRVPRAIILDLMMPNMDGFEFVAELRRNPAWREIPIVVLTAKVLSDEDRRRLNGGVQKIMAKGAGTREELMNELQQVIKTIAPAHHAAAHV